MNDDLKTSETGIKFIKSFEGCFLKAYPDPATGGEPWTIGWGTTGTVILDDSTEVNVFPGMICSQAEADRWLLEQIEEKEKGVRKLVKVGLTQGEFDALVSFAYNCGLANLETSTLLRDVNASEFDNAADQFLRWDRANGRVMNGLLRRRQGERAMFLS